METTIVKPRQHPSRVLAAVGFVLVVLAATGCGSPVATSDPFADGRLPADLGDVLPSLVELHLEKPAAEATVLDQATKLRRLTLIGLDSEAQITLPAGLQYLRLEGVVYEALPDLPTSLVELELEAIAVGDLSGLPPDLRLLNLELTGVDMESLRRLPPGLLSLRIDESGLEVRRADLPSDLTELDVKGAASVVLPSSRGLQRLALDDIDEVAVGRFPTSLRVVSLRDVEMLNLASMPKLTRELVLDTVHGEVAAADLPAELRSLELIETTVRELRRASPVENGPLFPRLETLVLRAELGLPLPALLAETPELRHLTVRGKHLAPSDPPAFPVSWPGELKSLGVLEPEEPVALPSGLRELVLLSAEGETIPSEHGAVEALALELGDLTGVDLDSRLAGWPRLQTLSLAGSRLIALPDFSTMEELRTLDLSSVALSEPADSMVQKGADQRVLPGLPPGLRSLNVSYSQIASLPDLPAGLQRLDVANSGLEALAVKEPLKKLTHLTIHAGQLPRLDDKFPQLESLTVVEKRFGPGQ